jgi:hypothetical protein
MRHLSHLYRLLTVLSVGLIALATPLVALASNGGPNGN